MMQDTRSKLLASTATLLAAIGLLGCHRHPDQTQAIDEPIANEVTIVPNIAPEPRWNREKIILAALRVLTESALQHGDAEQAQLKGRRFRVRFRFGCDGSVAKGPRTWSYDPEKGVIRVAVQRDVDAKSPNAALFAGTDFEDLTGFTIQSPWLLEAGCPTAPFRSVPVTGPAISIVELHTADQSRAGRAEGPYKIVQSIASDAVPTNGLDLVVAGRLKPMADARAIHCGKVESGLACAITASIDSVAVENPESGEQLAEWGAQ